MRRLLRFLFHHFYHTFAWTYDFVAAVVSLNRWHDWVLAVLPQLSGPRVLELGYGPGHLQVKMRKLGLNAFGVDESRQMGRLALAQLRQARLPTTLSRGYAQFLPFDQGCFDSVVSTFPSEYIYDPQTLQAAFRVLKPGGRFVILPMSWMNGSNLADRLMSWLFHLTHQGESQTEDAEGRLKAHFAEAGFRVEMLTVEIRQSTVLLIVAHKP